MESLAKPLERLSKALTSLVKPLERLSIVLESLRKTVDGLPQLWQGVDKRINICGRIVKMRGNAQALTTRRSDHTALFEM
jgi:hypothetical protein